VFRDIGSDTMLGFAIGISRQGSSVVKTAKNVINELTSLDPKPFRWSGLTEGLEGALQTATSMVSSAMSDIADIVNSTRLSPEIESGAEKFTMVGVSRINGYTAGGAVVDQPRTTAQFGGIDYDRLAAAIAYSLNGIRVEMDPNGVLRIVEKARVRKE